MSNKIQINVIGRAGSGKSVIIGLIAKALQEYDIVSDITISDSEMGLYPTQYIDRAAKIANGESGYSMNPIHITINQNHKLMEHG